ncbi:MAG: endonuclease V, partial [Candidatus Ranarchaeia archaeon]
MIVGSKLVSINLEDLAAWQSIEAQNVLEEDCFDSSVKLIGGLDVAYGQEWAYGSLVLVMFPSFQLVDAINVKSLIESPYIPTFFVLREGPVLSSLIKKNKRKLDLLFVDGNGRMHPRRFGLACYIGTKYDIPTIGVAKKKLLGNPRPTRQRNICWIYHKNERIGAQLYLRPGRAPVFVSVGHKVSLPSAIEWVKRCSPGDSYPLPLILAHKSAMEL